MNKDRSMNIYQEVKRLLDDYESAVAEEMYDDDAVQEGEEHIIESYEDTLADIAKVRDEFAQVFGHAGDVSV